MEQPLPPLQGPPAQQNAEDGAEGIYKDWGNGLIHWVSQLLCGLGRGFFHTPISSNSGMSVNENNQGNDGGNSHQNVNINNQDHIANINSYNGWKGWDAVWDYSKGFMATRILSKKSCIIAKMNKNVMPSVVELPELIKEKKVRRRGKGPPPMELQFTISKTRVSDLAPYGKSVEAMCRGIPTYVAHEARGEYIFN
uniref:Gastrokine-1 n=1 Tax=Chelydra serpentina TaxID=8475 RepID=A0A8C3S7Y2_CHESE